MRPRVTIVSAKAAILRAAAWLEANPDRHTVGAFARDELGKPVPVASRQAYCFCALGRTVHELGVKEGADEWNLVERALALFDLFPSNVYDINDARGSGRFNRGNPEVIPFMRRIAA